VQRADWKIALSLPEAVKGHLQELWRVEELNRRFNISLIKHRKAFNHHDNGAVGVRAQ